jgi:hypothetical protein
MRLRLPTARRAATALAVVVAVAAAAVVWQNLPTPTDVFGPFEVRGEAGTPTTGRAVAATVTDVQVTPEVNSTKPAGIWVVVSMAIEGVVDTALAHGELVVGPNTYTPSDVFMLDSLFAQINPGITLRGSWVFDVEPSLVASGSSDPMTLEIWTGDSRLDTRLFIRIPTDGPDFSRVDQVTLAKPESSAS